MKYFCLFCLLFVYQALILIRAQSVVDTEKQRLYTVETNRFGGNWFLSVGGGVQMYLGDYDNKMNLEQRTSPALDVAVGKWFTPGMGIRLMYSGLYVKGATRNLNHSNGDVYDASGGLYKQKFDLADCHADVLFNLSNILCGYKEKRFYSIIPYIGFGWMLTWNHPRTDELNAKLGLLNTFRLSSRLNLNLDTRATLVNDRMDGEVGGGNKDGYVTATLGLSYKLGRKNWLSRSRSLSEAELAEIRQRLQVMTIQNASLRKYLTNNIPQPEKENKDKPDKEESHYLPVTITSLITFPLGKTTLSQEARINLGFLANIIKERPNKAIYTVTGYADKNTGSAELNERLSGDRAEAVRACLVNEYGVWPEQLNVQIGSTANNQYYNDPRLYRAVIIQVEYGK